MSASINKVQSGSSNPVVVDLKSTKNSNRLETIKKVLKIASIILFLGATAAFSFYLMSYLIPVIIPSKILLSTSISCFTSSAFLAFSQTIVEAMISVKKAYTSRSSKKSLPKFLSSGASLRIENGDQKAGMLHIMEKHVSKGKYPEFSKFDTDNKDEVISLILEGWQMKSRKLLSDENGKVKMEIEMDRKIGYGKDKKPATKLIIVFRQSDNYLITAFPRCN